MFEWDEHKNKINVIKHSIDFKLAAEVFSDPKAIIQFSREQNGEKRYQIIGSIAGELVILLVAFTHRQDKIRIISARKASKKERQLYG